MSVKGTFEGLIRDKLSVVFIALYLLYSVLFEVETFNEIIRLIGLVVLVLGIIYENHRHIEKVGNTEKSKDLILEFKDHFDKEIQRIERNEDPTTTFEESDSTIEDLYKLYQIFKELQAKPDEEEPVIEESVEEVGVP